MLLQSTVNTTSSEDNPPSFMQVKISDELKAKFKT